MERTVNLFLVKFDVCLYNSSLFTVIYHYRINKHWKFKKPTTFTLIWWVLATRRRGG